MKPIEKKIVTLIFTILALILASFNLNLRDRDKFSIFSHNIN